MNRNTSSNIFPQYSTWAVISLLTIISIISFGLLIPYLGFFWDDYPLVWIAEVYGSGGLERYFSTNRPFWGVLYQITTPILGSTPWHWQVFAIIWRILSALLFWVLLRLVWRRSPTTALFGSLTFLVFPGFTQQWISVIYSHFFIIMTVFISSLVFNILAVRAVYESGKSIKSIVYTAVALFLSMSNLLSMEYFFTLELIRPFILWIILGEFIDERKDRLRKTLLNWSPYLAVFISIVIWRIIFFPYQTTNYQLSFFNRLSHEPLWALISLFQNIITSLWRVSIQAWLQVFQLPNVEQVGRLTTTIFFVLVVVTFLLVLFWFAYTRFKAKVTKSSNDIEDINSFDILSLSFIAMFLAGWPFWLIDISPSLNFSLDRFTMPFMLGSALFITGLIQSFQVNFTWKFLIFIILISFSVGTHFRLANGYRRDWETQRRFFWQTIWRIPNLKIGTTMLVNELPLTYYSDNSLTAPLNWIYDPGNKSEFMSYLLAYPARRLGSSLPNLDKNQTFEVDYLASTFIGNTSQVVTIYYDPPACLRVLDDKLDAVNHMLPLLMQKSATLSSFENILSESPSRYATPPEEIFAPEDDHGWCFYYQKAELARQRGDWEEIVRLAEHAFALGDYPNDPAERLPYIEGYARSGNWGEAIQQTEETLSVSSKMAPVLCLVWQRIDNGTIQSPGKQGAFNSIIDMLNCSN